MSSSENILALIPGDYISAAGQTLPDCATAPDEPRDLTIDVAGRFTARITFRRFHFKRGKMDRLVLGGGQRGEGGLAPQRSSTRAASHRITSSARSSTSSGTLMPIARATRKSMINSTFDICSIGNSAGLEPLRILST